MVLGDLPLRSLLPNVDKKTSKKTKKAKKAQQTKQASQAKKLRQAQKAQQAPKVQQAHRASESVDTVQPEEETPRPLPTFYTQQIQAPQKAPPVYYAKPKVKFVETPLTDTTQLYLLSVGSPNLHGLSAPTSGTGWSLLFIDTLQPEKATLHSLTVATNKSAIARARSHLLNKGTGWSLSCDVQLALAPPAQINFAEYGGKSKAKDTDAGTDLEGYSASAILDEVIQRGIPLTTLYPAPPAHSFDAFDDDFNFKRGISSPDHVILSYCHIGTHSSLKSALFAQHYYNPELESQLTFEGFRRKLINAMAREPSEDRYYSSLLSRPGYDVRDMETRLTRDWAVRVVRGVHRYFELSDGMLSGHATDASPMEHIESLLDAKTRELKELE
ncbi:hypothetical protein MD484_g6439, partial [Candolleomyces efflorescens]